MEQPQPRQRGFPVGGQALEMAVLWERNALLHLAPSTVEMHHSLGSAWLLFETLHIRYALVFYEHE